MSDASPHLVGQLISGRYRVLDVLGTGGMGKVYLAEHVAIQKKVALKVLHREYSSKQDIVERFRQEAISASRIKHPNVLEIFDFGELPDGSSFIAMELLEGRDLGQALEKDGPLPPTAAIDVVLQICWALEAAHARGVVHRDLKPDNVFLQEHDGAEPSVKIVDFGIASLRTNEELAQQEQAGSRRRLTKTGMIFGTPEYMAPEQAQGRRADERSDVYAVGVILFETLTGAVPFAGETFLEVLNRHVLFPIPRLADVNGAVQVSTELEEVVRRAMAKDPAARFPSMREFAEALLLTPEAATLPPPKSSAFAARPVREGTPRSGTQVRGTPLSATSDVVPQDARPRSRAPLVAAVIVVAALGAGAGLWWSQGRPASLAAAAPGAELSATSAPSAAAEAPATADRAEGGPAEEADGEAGEAVPGEDLGGDPQDEPGETTHVRLQVITTPPGAVLFKDDFQVCDSTPCEVRAEVDENLVLTARLGNRTGRAKVLAQRDQRISIALAPAPKARKPATTAAAPAPESSPKLCEVVVDGLKILRPCP